MKLLLVEDDKDLAEGLVQALQAEGFIVSNAMSGEQAKTQHVSFKPHLVVLDLGLPDIDGTELIRYFRRNKSAIPILILTARDGLDDKVNAFDIGADDYLAKPFDMPELLARLRVMSRRLGAASCSEIAIGEVTLDVASHQVLLAGVEVSLPRKEFMTLKMLMEDAGRIKTKDMLEHNIYDWSETIGSNTIEVYISNLRKKLPRDFIKTIRGVGYTINPHAS